MTTIWCLWGIFTEKLPIYHIFERYFEERMETNGTDNITLESKEVGGGKFLGIN